MDVLLLSRVQFAFTAASHYLYPPLSIGLGVVLVVIEALWLKTGRPIYHQMARFWTKVFALTFSMGVATGIVMEFEFGTNWATYSRFVGDVFGSALAAEGIFAFFLESGFLAVLVFGWDKVSRGVHFFATCMVCLGAHFSAVWIVVANSWQQTPAGFRLEPTAQGPRAVITDFWAMVFNPSSMDRLSHVLCGAWQAGAFLVVSVSAFYLLRRQHDDFARASMKTGLGIALVALIFRAVAIEFRSKRPMRWWRQGWDVGFAGGSVLSSFLIGVAMGNIAWGVPIDERGEFAGTFLGLLHPYALLLGVTTVALFMMHGSIYVVMKTEGDLQTQARQWVGRTIIFFIICYAVTTMATLLYVPHMAARVRANPWLFTVALANMLAIANIPREIHHGRDFRAFLSSGVAMVALMTLFGLEMFPNLVLSNPESRNSLTAYNAASSSQTLGIMLTIAVIGVPVVLAYTISIYWIFRGKVKLDAMSY